MGRAYFGRHGHRMIYCRSYTAHLQNGGQPNAFQKGNGNGDGKGFQKGQQKGWVAGGAKGGYTNYVEFPQGHAPTPVPLVPQAPPHYPQLMSANAGPFQGYGWNSGYFGKLC